MSLPRPKLRHGRRHAHFSFLNLTLNWCILFSVLSVILLSHLPSLLTCPIVLLPGSQLRSSPTTWDLTFLFPSQRPCVAEPGATCPCYAEPSALRNIISLFALFFTALSFSRQLQISSCPLPLALTKLSIPC